MTGHKKVYFIVCNPSLSKGSFTFCKNYMKKKKFAMICCQRPKDLVLLHFLSAFVTQSIVKSPPPP